VDPPALTLDWLRPWLPAGCALASGPIGEPGPAPHPEEEAAIARAVAKRRFEFRAGRACARQAVVELGGPAGAIGRGPAGEPIWPAGFTGSITHTDDLAAAVVARASAIRAIGLDMEDDAPLDAMLTGVVGRPEELSAAAAAGPHDLDPAKRLLVCKEAFIKFNYALTGTLAELLDIRIDLGRTSKTAQGFHAIWSPRRSGFRSAGYEGRLAWSCGRVASLMYVRRTGDS
jgi:4'-phosphopantetheinyl transferase EntD